MKKIIINLLILIFLINCQTIKNSKVNLIDVEIEQNGEVIKINKNIISLKKEPFYIIIHLYSNVNDIYLNVSNKSKLFDIAIAKHDITKVIGFGGTGCAEDKFNESTDLFLTDYGWHVWYYTDDFDHRFKKVIKATNELICFRYVDSIFYLDETSKAVVRIEDMEEGFLYFVFADIFFDKNNKYNLKKIMPVKVIFE